MNASLFIPCFVDALAPQAGIAMVQVLERLGCTLDYPKRQTCCGQPAFNAGHHDEARAVADWFLDCFRHAERIVVPSGSCAAMVKVFYRDLFAGTPREEDAAEVGRRTYEFSDFVVNHLGVSDTGSRFPARATFHDGCHGLRELGLHAAARTLLASVRELELVEMTEAGSCCGFGGVFSVKFPQISTAMAEVKARSILETGADAVVSGDTSCLIQIEGYLRRQGRHIRCLHLAEVLACT